MRTANSGSGSGKTTGTSDVATPVPWCCSRVLNRGRNERHAQASHSRLEFCSSASCAVFTHTHTHTDTHRHIRARALRKKQATRKGHTSASYSQFPTKSPRPHSIAQIDRVRFGGCAALSRRTAVRDGRGLDRKTGSATSNGNFGPRLRSHHLSCVCVCAVDSSRQITSARGKRIPFAAAKPR